MSAAAARMESLTEFMLNRFAPAASRITGNVWVRSLQESVMAVVPLILVGSVITLVSIANSYWSWMPDLTPVNQFSFGLIGLIVAFVLPYYVMYHKNLRDRRLVAGMTGVATYLMLIGPTFSSDGATISFAFERLGAVGMISAIVAGLAVALLFTLSARVRFFRTDVLPDFLVVWFESLLPILASLVLTWLCTAIFDWDMYAAIQAGFSPLVDYGQSFGGFVTIYFLIGFLYSFGLSSWLLVGLLTPIMLTGIQDNAAAVAAGHAATNINTLETSIAWLLLGGVGSTLPLTLMMAFLARSARLKAVGRASLIPGIANINEPVVFGAPIAFNPTLMVPMWINSLVLPIITWGALSSGLVPVPHSVFQLWYLPAPFIVWAVTPGVMGLLLMVVNFAVASLIWFPFFQVHDRQAAAEDEDADVSPAPTSAGSSERTVRA
jgi:PTS system cellobiose-specific IIC component